MLPSLAALSPNAAILLFTVGVALIAVELNRPGWILPGALGILVALVSLATLVYRKPAPLALTLLLSASVILLLQARYEIRFWIVCLGAAAGVVGFALLPGVRFAVAVACALILVAGTTVLTRIARRARQNKGLD
jgi:membrane-bound ClpP family serine protease